MTNEQCGKLWTLIAAAERGSTAPVEAYVSQLMQDEYERGVDDGHQSALKELGERA